jgi:hypothetical protein
MKRQFAKPLKRKNKGQSLVELTLILTVLLTLLVGMVEFGNLLNQYINVVDGTREGARFGSNDDPFAIIMVNNVPTPNYEIFFAKIYTVVEGHYDVNGVQRSKGAINPIVLNKDNGDDIVVSFFSVATDGATGALTSIERFESAAGSRYNNQTSRFTDGQISARMDGLAPSTGVLLVEVFYHYYQILRLYSFIGVPDPILVHTYSVMPLSAAEPTPTPNPAP